MISYSEAKNIIIGVAKKHQLALETINSLDSIGHVVAEDVKAPISVQPFDNSAMDGFGVRYDDLKAIENGASVTLIKNSVIAAGDGIHQGALKSGECCHIMTGAPVPQGVDTVIPVELVTVDGNNVVFSRLQVLGSHIRKAGEDFKCGDIVLRQGSIIKPQHIMVFAALGIDKVTVYKKTKAVFIATGKELVDDLSQELKGGEIYNANLPYACTALQYMGAECINAVTVFDGVDNFNQAIDKAITDGADVIISSGAVSAGEFDFVRSELEKRGAEILFHKVVMKPGKPNLLAVLPNGSIYFGLPGNPVSTAVGLRFFVAPALRAMLCLDIEQPIFGKLVTEVTNKKHLQLFLKAGVKVTNDGAVAVDLLDGQASFMVSPFLNMNAWAVVKPENEKLEKGDLVEFYPLWPDADIF